MKRILIAMLLVCTLLCSLLVSVGATGDEPTDPPCEHNYELSMDDFVDPTCTEGGTKVEICTECGDRKETPVEKLGHDFTIELENVAADCENDGHITMKCSRCDETDTEELESKGHAYSVIDEVEASCTQKGSVTYKCDECGAEDTIEIKMLEHTYTVVVENTATCTTAGTKTLKCETCTDTIERDAAALGHDYPTTPNSDTATCKADGIKTYICKNGCGIDKTEASPKNTNHTYGAWEVVTEATCGKNGSKKATCTVCGNVKTETITGGTHNYGTVKYITKLPSTSAAGTYAQYCLNCNAKNPTTGSIPKFTSSSSSKDLSAYTLPPIVASPVSGDVTEGTKVKLTFITGTQSNISNNATIYYTTNGRAPTTSNSEEYTSTGIEIDEDMTIKAFAVYDDDEYGIKKTTTYTFTYTVTECEHTSLNTYKYVTKLPTSKKAGTYVQYCNNCGEAVEKDIKKGTTNLNSYYTARPELTDDIEDIDIGDTVYLTCALDDVIIYYTTDGKSPTSAAYRKTYDDDEGIEIEDEDTVIKAYCVYDGDDFTIKNSTIVTFEFEAEECDHDYGSDKYITKFPTKSSNGTYVQYCEECGEEDENSISKSKYTDDLDDYMIARPTPEDGKTKVRAGTKVKFEVGDIDLDDVTIYYALGGKSPTSSAYRKTYDDDEGIEIEDDTTVKLYAVYTGDDFEPENSDVVTYKFTVTESEHDFGQMYITKVPTTSATGAYIAYCEDDDCDETETGTIPKGETDLEDYMLHPLTPSVKEGKVAYGTKLTFTKKLNAVKIYYTTDGKSPVTSSTRKEYTTAGIELTNAVTVVKVYSVYTGNSSYGIEDSEIQTFTYQVEMKKIQLKSDANRGGYMPSLGADKKFRPDAKATRYEVIDAMNNLFNTNVTASTTVYKDVDAAHKDVVARFIAAGLLNGYDDGTFKGTNNIKRSELCKVLAIALGIENQAASSTTKKFPDVAQTHWAYRYISVLTAKGYLAGDTNGNFRPEDNITRAELVVVLNRIAQVNPGKGVTIADVHSTHWAYGYVCGSLLRQ